jgi:hypothetical protein
MLTETNFAFRRELVWKLLLHRGVSRGQISRASDVTMAAISRHVRWMLDSGLVRSQAARFAGASAGRPVETLSITDLGTRAIAIRVSRGASTAEAELVASDGDVHGMRSFTSPGGQLGLLDMVREALAWAGEDKGPRTVVLALDGLMEPDSGVVFAVNGIPDWQACLPSFLLPLQGGKLTPWTPAAASLFGAAWEHGRDDRIGLVSLHDGRLHIASLHQGHIQHGRFGTTGSAVHATVSDDRRRCYCGRQGCLADLLAHGAATPGMVADVLPRLLAELRVDHLSLEWPEDTDLPRRILEQAGVTALACDPARHLRDGLRLAAAWALIAPRLDDQRPVPTLAAPEALREPQEAQP